MSEDYKTFNRAFARILHTLKYDEAAKDVRESATSEYAAWKIALVKESYFKRLPGKPLSDRDKRFLNDLFKDGEKTVIMMSRKTKTTLDVLAKIMAPDKTSVDSGPEAVCAERGRSLEYWVSQSYGRRIR